MSDKLEFTGERFLPGAGGEIWYEHWHRYHFAAKLVVGREVLDVACGAGYGSALLARQAQRVVGADISAETIDHARALYAAVPNLEFRQADCAALPFPDASFDAVYTLSSIEHFGSPGDIKRSAREIGRVLRPGGYAFVVTELLVRLHPLDSAPADFARRLLTLGRRHRRATLVRRSHLDDAFNQRELRRRIVQASGLELLQPLDLSLSPESWHNLAHYAQGTSEVVTPTGSFYPHILLRVSRSVFTSVALALRKPV